MTRCDIRLLTQSKRLPESGFPHESYMSHYLCFPVEVNAVMFSNLLLRVLLLPLVISLLLCVFDLRFRCVQGHHSEGLFLCKRRRYIAAVPENTLGASHTIIYLWRI